jgi:TatD DNase family protein
MPMGLVDSHCHLNFDPLGKELDAVLHRARDAGVTHMLCVAVTVEKLPEVIAIAEAHATVFASVGVHPDHAEDKDPSVAELVALADHPRVVAIGETGLDYFRLKGDLEWQRERFRRHIRAARETGKPLIIHTREAAEDTIRILREESAQEVGGVMHCFTESREVASAALDLGFYISFSGIVTFRNADVLRSVAAQVPANRLLVETDAPYLAPMPHRGKTNEPAYVRHVAELLATLRGTSLEEISAQTSANFFSLFTAAKPVDSAVSEDLVA